VVEWARDGNAAEHADGIRDLSRRADFDGMVELCCCRFPCAVVAPLPGSGRLGALGQ